MGVNMLVMFSELLFTRSWNSYESLRTNIRTYPVSFTFLSLKLTSRLKLNTSLSLMFDDWFVILEEILMNLFTYCLELSLVQLMLLLYRDLILDVPSIDTSTRVLLQDWALPHNATVIPANIISPYILLSVFWFWYDNICYITLNWFVSIMPWYL